MRKLTQTLYKILSSRQFAVVVLALFVFQAVWIAFSAVYPMAFDEEFHWGIIKFYSNHWLPFVSSQPAGSGQYGAIIADPSYLFHYLMSFPYRILQVFTQNETTLIIILRLMNVAMFTVGLVWFYKLLRRVGTSRLLSNSILALFTLIPIVPLLAAHINYDNLLMVLTAWCCWLTLDIYGGLKKRQFNHKAFGILAIVGTLSALVKYAFLPILMAIVGYLIYQIWRAFRGHKNEFKKALVAGVKSLSTKSKVVLITLFVVSAGLFAQRYVVNVVRYHTPLPDCSAVIGVDECMAYGPWARDYKYAQDKGEFNHSPLRFTASWFGGMHRRLFFMITGKTRGYVNFPPMPVIANAAIVMAVAGILALIFYWRRVFAGHPELYLFVVITLVYCAVLWLNGYKDYLSTGRAVAINGRYLLLILFFFMAVAGRALAIALHRWKTARTWLVVVAILLFLQGGGVISFILRSNERWYWPNSVVTSINNGARQILRPFIIE